MQFIIIYPIYIEKMRNATYKNYKGPRNQAGTDFVIASITFLLIQWLWKPTSLGGTLQFVMNRGYTKIET